MRITNQQENGKKNSKQRPLYMKISLLHCLIIFCVVTVLVLLIGRIASNILIEQKTENSRKDLFAVAEKLDMLLSGYERDSQAIIKNQNYQDLMLMEEGASRSESVLRSLRIAIALADFHSSFTKIKRIRFYDMVQQNIIDDYPVKSHGSVPPSWERIYAFIDTQDTYRWTEMFATEQEMANISFLHLVNNYSGKLIGVLELIVDELQINQMYRSFESDDMRFYLVDGTGRIISCTEKSKLGTAFANPSAFSKVTASDFTGGSFTIDSVSSLLVSKKYDKLSYWLISVADRKAIVEDVNKLIWTIILIGASGIITASLLVRWTAKASTYPLERILSVIDSVSHGNYSARVDVQDSGEYCELEQQLNKMIDSIVDMMSLIEQQSEQKRMNELQNLQMQMNPHFLYNSLETVCGIIDVGDSQLAIRMINDISRFYRGVLSGGNSMVTIAQEIQITERYLDIVRIRYCDSFDFVYKIQNEMLQTEIPKLILQPLVENAVVHGFNGKRPHTKLWIHGYIQDDLRIIRISDNGYGMKPDELERVLAGEKPRKYQNGGFGLRGVEQRIKLAYGDQFGLRVWSQYGIGTRVAITLPLEKQEEQS